MQKDEDEWMEKGITLISNEWLVEVADLPNNYSSWSVADVKSPMSIVIFCILVLFICLR
jgi:regulation of enolase protein 1 (concanavalin A-like superfamily)